MIEKYKGYTIEGTIKHRKDAKKYYYRNREVILKKQKERRNKK